MFRLQQSPFPLRNISGAFEVGVMLKQGLGGGFMGRTLHNRIRLGHRSVGLGALLAILRWPARAFR